jgi:hypothetical protein
MPASLRGEMPASLLSRSRFPGRDRHGPAIGSDGHHREVAAVGVPDRPLDEVLRGDAHADLHGRAAGPVDARVEGHQFADVDGFAEDDLVDRQRDRVRAGLAGRTCVGDLVEVLEEQAAVDVAREVRNVGGHQNCHRQTVQVVGPLLPRTLCSFRRARTSVSPRALPCLSRCPEHRAAACYPDQTTCAPLGRPQRPPPPHRQQGVPPPGRRRPHRRASGACSAVEQGVAGGGGLAAHAGCTWWVSGQRDGGVSVPERLADTLRRAARRRAAARPGVASVVPPDHRRLLSSSALRACAVWAPERAEPLRPPRAPSIPLQQGRCPDGVDQVWSTLRYRPGLGRLPLAAGDRRAAQPCTAHVTDSASRSVNGIPPCA